MKGRRGNEDGQKHAIYTLAELRGIRWREIYRDLQIMRLCFKRPPFLRGLFSLFFPSPALGRPCVSTKDSLLAAFSQNFLHLCFDLGRKIEEDRKKECLGSWNIFFLFLRGCRRSKFRYRSIFLSTSIRPKFHLETKREFNIYLLLWGSTKEALTLVLGHVPYTNLENLENHRSENRKIGCERQEEREIAKRRNQKKARKPKQ